MEKKFELKEIFAMLGLIVFLLVIVAIVWIMDGKSKENNIKDYKTIVVDGIEYDTRDIKDIASGGYSGAIKIKLTNGTEIRTTTYTLKN